MDKNYLTALVDLIASRDPDKVRETVTTMMQLPPQAEKAMRATAVDDTHIIPTI